MPKSRHIAALAAALALAVPAIGINRVVVTDGEVTAATAHPPGPIAFKSDYFPLER